MDNGSVVLTVECREPEGQVIRTVRHVALTRARIQHYWSKVKQFRTLFNSWMGDSFEEFAKVFISQDTHGDIFANGLVYEIDDVGLFGVSNVVPGHDALLHFCFWDRRIRGREELVRKFVCYLVMELDLVRVSYEVPLYVQKWLPQAVERIGFVKEGRKRKDVLYEGQYFDMNIYSMLREEAFHAAKETRSTVASDSVS